MTASSAQLRKHGNEATIKKYIQEQGAEYKQLHKEQLNFDTLPQAAG
jgi:hypothetical protein